MSKSDNEPEIMTYKDHLQEMSGSGIVYDSEARAILREWKSATWVHVDEYIAPIVMEILIDAAETNRELYEKIMNCVVEVYPELQRELGLYPAPELTLIK